MAENTPRLVLRAGDRVAEVSEDELDLPLNGLGAIRDNYCTSAAEEEPIKLLEQRLEAELLPPR